MQQVIAERDDYPGAAPIGGCQSARLAAQRRTSAQLRCAVVVLKSGTDLQVRPLSSRLIDLFCWSAIRRSGAAAGSAMQEQKAPG